MDIYVSCELQKLIRILCTVKYDKCVYDRIRDGGTDSTLRIKEQEKPLTLNEYDDDDDEFRQLPCLQFSIYRNKRCI